MEWVVVTKIKSESGVLEGFEISINGKEIYLDIELAKCVAKEILDIDAYEDKEVGAWELDKWAKQTGK